MTTSSLTSGTAPASLREVAGHATLVFACTLTIQATTFAILAGAGLMLPTSDFARLSLIVAATMLSSALFEFGLNITSTKMYGDTGDEAFLRTAFLIRLLGIPAGFTLGLAAAVLTGATDIGLGIGLGAALNLWNGVRASDQARQDYRSLLNASLSFAAFRAVAGLGALYLTRDPVIIALASYLVPILGSAFSTSARYAVEAFTGPRRPVNDLVWYATHVYLNALTFIAIPYVPQFLVAARLDEIAVGTYGLILTFTAPVSLLVYSLRSVLLPKMLQPGVRLEELLWSRRGFLIILCSWTVLSAGGILVASALQLFYAHKFPDIGPAFAAFFVGFSGAAMVGFYSLSAHTQAVPHLSTGIGLIKFVVLLGLLSLFGRTLLETVVLTGFVMFAGEVALALTLGARRRKAAP